MRLTHLIEGGVSILESVFSDFTKHKIVDEDVILKYKDKLPKELIETWKKYGFGSFLNDYLKVINPDDFLDILERSYIRYEQAIPIFTTLLGDIICGKKESMLIY